MIILGELIKIRGSDNYSDTGGLLIRLTLVMEVLLPQAEVDLSICYPMMEIAEELRGWVLVSCKCWL